MYVALLHSTLASVPCSPARGCSPGEQGPEPRAAESLGERQSAASCQVEAPSKLDVGPLESRKKDVLGCLSIVDVFQRGIRSIQSSLDPQTKKCTNTSLRKGMAWTLIPHLHGHLGGSEGPEA